ncbi:hypothetical protein [Gemella cuniculi]|uniref:hypothetical protein n=1 Tax=Gemella cuniculi TaxID=150240 RepID=UPI0003FC7E50|nr:hypothetical protein [Gemella cuniculi]
MATFAIVGTADWIASYKVMEERIEKIKRQGRNAVCLVYKNLPHGFGLGEGTAAQEWIEQAIKFWENEYR